MNGRLLVVEAQRRVVADESPVREERLVAEGKFRDDWDLRSRVGELGHFGDSGACVSEDWQASVDGWDQA